MLRKKKVRSDKTGKKNDQFVFKVIKCQMTVRPDSQMLQTCSFNCLDSKQAKLIRANEIVRTLTLSVPSFCLSLLRIYHFFFPSTHVYLSYKLPSTLFSFFVFINVVVHTVTDSIALFLQVFLCSWQSSVNMIPFALFDRNERSIHHGIKVPCYFQPNKRLLPRQRRIDSLFDCLEMLADQSRQVAGCFTGTLHLNLMLLANQPVWRCSGVPVCRCAGETINL